MRFGWLLSLVSAAALSFHAQGATPTPFPALLVGEKAAGLLAIVDPQTLQIVARVPANRSPHEVATDGKFAYVSNSGADAITVIDLAAQKQVAPIPLGAFGPTHGLWVAGGKLYFANEGTRMIGRYDPAAQKIDWAQGTGQRSHLLIVSPDGSKIFTSNVSSSSMGVLEMAGGGRGGGNWSMTTIPAGNGIEGFDVSPDAKEIWGVNVRDQTITAASLADKTVLETIAFKTNYSNRIKFTRDGRYVLVSDLKGTDLIVFDRATRKEIKRIDVGGGAEGVFVAPDGARAFVAVSTAGKVAVIDLATLTVSGRIGDFQNPDGMAWAERQK